MEKIEKILLKEAIKAYKEDEVPVGCVITKEEKIIAKAHNTRQKKHKCINHAEINAIIKAEKKLKDWRLNGCTMYVTLKPCSMCNEVIKQARIKNIFYIIDSKFSDTIKNVDAQIMKTDNDNIFNQLLVDFFKKKR